MPTIWVRVPGQRAYPIVIAPGSLSAVGRLARAHVSGRSAAILTHPRIHHRYGPLVEKSMAAAGFRTATRLILEGEPAKSLDQAERIIGWMIGRGFDRSACVVALGGGVIGDLAGFVAAVYMRGLDLIQVPTTLLAQVDSSVGGKVAVNHPLGKNLIGAFHQPRLVVSDPDVLDTLSPRQFRSGLAEVIKAAIIADAGLFADLEHHLPGILARRPEVLGRFIRRACEIKAAIVRQDEREHGVRAILNYGHTFGHALEAYHHYRGYLHGEAAAIGMAIASRLAADVRICSEKTAQRQAQLLARAGLPVSGAGESVAKLWQIMKTDKKAREGQLNIVLTPKIGRARITKKLPPFSVKRAISSVILSRNHAGG